MPCKCGQKVDRTHNKVQCAGCSELFHLDCVGILLADLEFLLSSNKPFFCNACSLERRTSIRSPSTPVPPPETKRKESANIPVHIDKQQVTLLTVANQIAALSADNNRILSLIVALHEDKIKLLQKSEALHAEVRSLHATLKEKESDISSLISEVKYLRRIVAGRVNNFTPTSASGANFDNNNVMMVTASPAQLLASSSSDRALSLVDVSAPLTSCSRDSSSAALGSASTYSAAVSNSSKVLTNAATNANAADFNTSTSASALTSLPPNSMPTSNVAVNALAVGAPVPKRSYASAAACAAVNAITATDANVTAADKLYSAGSPSIPADKKKKKKKRTSARNVVVGKSNNNDLDVFTPKKWIHLSSFKPSVTEENILSYVEKNAGIDKDNLSCFKLVKKDADFSSFKKVNFKLGVIASLYDKVVDPVLWPANVVVRPFQFFQRESPQINQA